MKTLSIILALSVMGTTAAAFSLNAGGVTPTLSFPTKKPSTETVTMEKVSAAN